MRTCQDTKKMSGPIVRFFYFRCMNKSRLEAFSDGVFAIIITITVLQMQVPSGADWNSLKAVLPVFLTYIFSFIMVGIYWNNHHHLFQAVKKTNGKILWANLHLLFWLSMFPFATGWVGNNHFAELPVRIYGIILFMAAVAYSILIHSILQEEGGESFLARVIKKDRKGNLSTVLYAIAVGVSFFSSESSVGIFLLVALIWLVPDRRIEKDLR